VRGIALGFVASWILALGASATLYQSPVLQDDYLFAALDHRQRLLEVGRDAQTRFVLLGGSSIAWSVAAADIEIATGIPTVNAAVHAGIGFPRFFDYYGDLLDPERDVLVFSPEYESIMVGPQTGLGGHDCDLRFLAGHLAPTALLCAPYTIADLEFFMATAALAVLGTSRYPHPYARSAFNERGDFVGHLGLDPPGFDAGPIDLSWFSPSSDRVSEWNDFIEALTQRGFRIVMIPTSTAESACPVGVDLSTYHAAISVNATFTVAPGPGACIGDDAFFDTTYHMNAAGRTVNTARWVSSLLAFLDWREAHRGE
jgi:hypothetical protein